MESKDMRAPLAVLSVLWYHVLMKPFFTENFTEEEMRETTDLIDKYSTQYPQSSLFLFFKGRAWRLQKNLDAALDEYAKAQVHYQHRLIHGIIYATEIAKLCNMYLSLDFACTFCYRYFYWM